LKHNQSIEVKLKIDLKIREMLEKGRDLTEINFLFFMVMP